MAKGKWATFSAALIEGSGKRALCERPHCSVADLEIFGPRDPAEARKTGRLGATVKASKLDCSAKDVREDADTEWIGWCSAITLKYDE